MKKKKIKQFKIYYMESINEFGKERERIEKEKRKKLKSEERVKKRKKIKKIKFEKMINKNLKKKI